MSKYVGRIITDQAPAGYSVYFDGTGDYLTVPANAAFNFGTGDFTVEFWLYFQNLTGFQTIFDISYTTSPNLLFQASSGAMAVYMNGGSTVLAASAVSNGTWNHFALVRSGTTVTLYLNGVSVSSATYSGNVGNSTSIVYVGGSLGGGGFYLNGYLSNVRVVKGTALYTANFAPPTQLFPVTNTSLLTCQSPSIIDNSSNAFAITTNGNAAVSTFTPFTAYNPYNPSLGASTPGVWTLDEAMQAAATRQWNMYDPSFQNTTLLLHGNGTNGAQNNTFLDSSSNNFTITRNGNTTQGSFSPFSQTGWSNYFNGTTDYLSVADNAAFEFGGNNFTIEMWVYPTSTNQYQTFIGKDSAAGTRGFILTSDTQYLIFAIAASTTVVTTRKFVPNQWNFLTVTRSGSNIYVGINGVVESFAWTSTIPDASSPLVIGAQLVPGGAYANFFPGYISNLRVVNGSSVATYQANFTPPTTPLTAITNTSLLTCQSNRFVDNSTNSFAITLGGSPSVQAFSPFYPTAAYTPQTIGGSGYFDGTTDYLTVANNAAFQLGTGDFTLECWYYPEDISLVALFGLWGPTSSNASYLMYLDASGYPVWYTSTNGSTQTASLTSTVAVTLRAWNHIVITRLSGTTRIFVNGTSGGSTSTSVSLYAATSQFTIGYNPIGGTPDNVQGYLSDVRILKGTGYSSITVPTAPLTNITNTSLLLNFTNAGIVDSTAKNVLETVGSAQISTTQSKFGGSSIYMAAATANTDYLVQPASRNIEFGTGNFTVEFWMWPTSITTNWSTGDYATILDADTAAGASTTDWWIIHQFNGAIAFASNNAIILTSSSALAASAWNHVALVRNNGLLVFYVNGVNVGSVTYTSAVGGNRKLFVGTQSGLTRWYKGYLDDLRITKGIARYTGNFTPQTSQWQDQ